MATPQQYAGTFDFHEDGRAVLADLVEKFGAELYVAGGTDAERATLVNLGQRRVLDHILKQINSNGA
jgi:hypothetical protein